MKKLFLAMVAVFMVASVNAQTGKKALKQATKAVAKYATNFTQSDQLQKGLSLVETAMQSEEVSKDPKSLIAVADLYSKVADTQLNQKMLNPNAPITNPEAALKGFQAIQSALDLAGDNKKLLKSALKTLPVVESSLNNLAIAMYNAEKYTEAYNAFSSSLKAVELLKGKGQATRLDNPELFKNQVLLAGVTGFYSDNSDNGIPFLEQSAKLGSKEPMVYEALYQTAVKKGQADKAQTYLSLGRELFPDNQQFLVAEINQYLAAGKLDQLISKLEQAKAADPKNTSIVLTLGNVYEQLSGKSAEKGDKKKEKEYFDKALSTYDEVIALDPSNFTAVYSQGVLWYNKAAALTSAINAASEDYSDAGTAKYNALKGEMNGYFEKALPYFIKAEGINGKDQNTLIALREIYAKQNKLDKAQAYKAKIDAL